MNLSKLCCVLGAALLLNVAPAFGRTHALIMSISEYGDGIPPLTGVKYDVASAREIAHKMGVRDQDIIQLQDKQLTLEGMRHAFDELARQVQPDDDVFIYYSGHGGRQYVHDPEDRCAESLISEDGYGFIDSELSARLKALSEKAKRIVVFLDSCHSGGATTRALHLNAGHPEFVSKFWSKSRSGTCSRPVNVLTRGISLKALTPGQGGLNYVYIAAARDNEVSFDEPGKGGVATQAWLKCMTGDARDLDGSGAITADELRVCAQAKIDNMLKGASGILPDHIKITGNPDAVLMFKEQDKPAPQPTAEHAAGAASPLPQVVQPLPPSAVPHANPPAAGNHAVADNGGGGNTAGSVTVPNNTLRDIYNNRDDRRVVTLSADNKRLRIGRDSVGFDLTSSEAGYVYLLMVGSDGKTFDLLFPNKLDQNNYIDANQTIHLPRSSWAIQAQGPLGTDHLLAVVADSARDFSKLGAEPSGPFSVVNANPAVAKDIQLVTLNSPSAASEECNDNAPRTRNLVLVKKCSNAYGAALLTLDEVR